MREIRGVTEERDASVKGVDLILSAYRTCAIQKNLVVSDVFFEIGSISLLHKHFSNRMCSGVKKMEKIVRKEWPKKYFSGILPV